MLEHRATVLRLDQIHDALKEGHPFRVRVRAEYRLVRITRAMRDPNFSNSSTDVRSGVAQSLFREPLALALRAH